MPVTIWLHMTVKINVGRLSLASEMNGRKHSAPYDAKHTCRVTVLSVGQ